MEAKKITSLEFGRRSNTYAALAGQLDQGDLDTVVGLLGASGNETVLDVATGTGYLALALSPHVKQVAGVDITLRMLELAVGAAREKGYGNIAYQVGDVEHLPFKDSGFDVVTCRFSFHHFPAPHKSLTEMVRVLRPGGRLVMVDMVSSKDPARSNYQNIMEHLRDPSHVRHYPGHQLVSFMQNAGLDIVEQLETFSDFEFEHWIKLADPPVGAVEQIRELMIASMDRDRSGLEMRMEAGKIRFTYSNLILVAQKR